MKHLFTLLLIVFASVYFTQAQNVGVGESAPGSKLSVKGNLSVGNSYSNISTNLPINGLVVEGNVGIGTSNPATQLHTTGTVRFQGLGGSGVRYVKVDNTGNLTGSTTVPWADITGAPAIGGNWTLTGSNLSPNNLGWNVGIGTSAPSTQLHTTGSVRFQGLGGSGNRYVRTDNNGLLSGTATVPWADITGAPAFITNFTELDPTWNGAANETGNIGRTGSVGIGITTPSEQLHVSGNVLASGIVYWGNAGSRTETRSDAGLQGNAGARSGFYETSSPSPAANWPVGASSWWHLLDIRHNNPANNFALQFAGSFFDQNLYFRKTNDNPATPWQRVLTDEVDPTWNGAANETGIVGRTGSVGIGTITPISTLHAAGNFTVGGGGSAGQVGMLQITTGGASPISNRLTYGTDGTGWKFAISKNQAGTITDQLTIQTDGNVGIGTTSPAFKLDVAGDIRADNGWIRTTGNTGWISDTWGGGWAMSDATWIRSQGNKSIYHNTGTMRTDGTFQVGSGGATFNVVNGGDLSYRTNVLYANTAGNVGIGTTAPATTLHVVGTTRISSLAGNGNRAVYADANGTLNAVPNNGAIDATSLLNGINWNAFFTSGLLGGGEAQAAWGCSSIQTLTIPAGDVPAGAKIAIISFRQADANESSAALKVYSGLTTSTADIVGIVGQAGRAGDGRSFYAGGTVFVPINANRQFRVSGCRQDGISATWWYMVVGTL